jgi:hypothetical protein
MSEPIALGPMPERSRMRTVDERIVHAAPGRVFELARAVEAWPTHLPHYRSVQLEDRRADGGGIVTMAAYRPFGPFRWPVWWAAAMQVLTGDGQAPAIRFRHVAGITRGMEVQWSFAPWTAAFAPASTPVATFVRIVHLWNGPSWPLIGGIAATGVIGPMFVHGIASRTLCGLATAAERGSHAVEQTGHDDPRMTSQQANKRVGR